MADSHPIENWRPVVGYEGLYEVSDLGSIRSSDRKWHPGRTLARVIAPTTGYLQVGLCRDKEQTTRMVHSLVLEAFVGPRPAGHEACHNNGVRSDCRLANLRYDTVCGNHADKWKHGTAVIGEKCHTARLTEADVKAMRIEWKSGADCASLGRKYGVSTQAAWRACNRTSWRHVT